LFDSTYEIDSSYELERRRNGELVFNRCRVSTRVMREFWRRMVLCTMVMDLLSLHCAIKNG
jgi:hypothetical protein